MYESSDGWRMNHKGFESFLGLHPGMDQHVCHMKESLCLGKQPEKVGVARFVRLDILRSRLEETFVTLVGFALN